MFAQYREKLPAEEAKRQATDYSAWDLWTPSDDEEDPWMQYMPNNPAFKAMEADIDKRHARGVEQRQTAHRKREEGNVAFKAGQYGEALKIYEVGLVGGRIHLRDARGRRTSAQEQHTSLKTHSIRF